MSVTVIISRSGSVRDSTSENALARRIAGQFGVPVIVTPHLYHLPDKSPLWQELCAIDGDIVLISRLFPRPAEWLFRSRGAKAKKITAYDMTFVSSSGEELSAVMSPTSDVPGEVVERKALTVTRWYPVVDRSRCTNCYHCLQFCLFGVHARTDEGELLVQNPDKCKPGCPACSRICPHGAIIFPLYDKDPAIAGAPGLYMQPDAAAMRMYYARSGAKCPICGESGTVLNNRKTSLETPKCQECGRPIKTEIVGQKSISPEDTTVADELDSLIDALDQLQEQK